MEFNALRRAGSSLAEHTDAKTAKELVGTFPTDSVMQYQLALRVELERQTRQLEDLLKKQADTAFQQTLRHQQEVQGISEAWQLVARTLGEQLSSVHLLQKKNQETCKRLEQAVLKVQENDAEEKKSVAATIEGQKEILQQHEQRMEKSMTDLTEKLTSLQLRPQLDLALPGQCEEESEVCLAPRVSSRISARKKVRHHRTMKVMRADDPVVEEPTFADMQKQYGIRLRQANSIEAAKPCCLREICIQIVAHKRFEMGCALLVILCALSIGVESDYTIRHALDPQHPVFRGLDITFNLCFALELAVRWISEGFIHFLACDNLAYKWNWMDLGLVSSSAVEEIATLLAAASFMEVSALRMLRMMRLVRVARIIRMLRFFSELRVMVNGIMGSAKPLLWAFVFLLILMFMVGVTFMQLAANYLAQDAIAADDALLQYWGSLARTMMTLYMAISGGIDWQDCVQPLHVVSWGMEYMFATYVFFTLFCCLNIVTGIFVDNAKALKSADEDAMYLEALTERKRWIAEVKDLFMRLDCSVNGTFTFEDFKVQVSNIKVQTLFRKLGINIDNMEAEELWEILDADQSGEIDEEEFAKGLKYFQGPAQSIHVYRLMKESARLHEKVEDLQDIILKCIPGVNRTDTSIDAV